MQGEILRLSRKITEPSVGVLWDLRRMNYAQAAEIRRQTYDQLDSANRNHVSRWIRDDSSIKPVWEDLRVGLNFIAAAAAALHDVKVLQRTI